MYEMIVELLAIAEAAIQPLGNRSQTRCRRPKESKARWKASFDCH